MDARHAAKRHNTLVSNAQRWGSLSLSSWFSPFQRTDQSPIRDIQKVKLVSYYVNIILNNVSSYLVKLPIFFLLRKNVALLAQFTAQTYQAHLIGFFDNKI